MGSVADKHGIDLAKLTDELVAGFEFDADTGKVLCLDGSPSNLDKLAAKLSNRFSGIYLTQIDWDDNHGLAVEVVEELEKSGRKCWRDTHNGLVYLTYPDGRVCVVFKVSYWSKDEPMERAEECRACGYWPLDPSMSVEPGSVEVEGYAVRFRFTWNDRVKDTMGTGLMDSFSQFESSDGTGG